MVASLVTVAGEVVLPALWLSAGLVAACTGTGLLLLGLGAAFRSTAGLGGVEPNPAALRVAAARPRPPAAPERVAGALPRA